MEAREHRHRLPRYCRGKASQGLIVRDSTDAGYSRKRRMKFGVSRIEAQGHLTQLAERLLEALISQSA